MTLSLVVGGSCVVSGLVGAVCSVDVRCCLDALPSGASSATSRLDVGNGNGVFAIWFEGAAAIGTSVIGGCCPCVDGCAACVGIDSSCCEDVCVSVVVCGLAIVFAVGKMMKPAAVGVVIGELLMTSKSC